MLPSSITAGDTFSQLLALSLYAASAGWVAKLRFVPRVGSGSAIELTATAEGDAHRFAAAAASTAGWSAGDCTAVVWVERSGESFVAFRQTLRILPDPRTASAGYDARSESQQALDDARAALRSWDPKVRRYKIGEREREFNSISELRKLISMLEMEVAREAGGLATAPVSGRFYYRRTS